MRIRMLLWATLFASALMLVGCSGKGEAEKQAPATSVAPAPQPAQAYRPATPTAVPAPPPAPTVQPAPKPNDSADPTVYVTKSGKKYHAAGCRYLAKSSIPMKLSRAKQRYAPCSVCSPPQ